MTNSKFLDHGLTCGQVQVVLEDIGTNARAIVQLALNMSLDGDCLSSAMSDAIVALAQRVGWAADFAHGPGETCGDVEAWMLPPNFRSTQIPKD